MSRVWLIPILLVALGLASLGIGFFQEGVTNSANLNAVGEAMIAPALTPSDGSSVATPSMPETFKVMAAGDIACGKRSDARCEQMETSDLIVQANPDAVIALGDLQYECGELDDFLNFFDPSWGRFKAKIRPAIGNHEYQVPRNEDDTQDVGICPNTEPGASGYWTYFGGAANPLDPTCRIRCQGYYSWDLGSWHFIVLNDQCSQRGVGGCDRDSPQFSWLLNDLATHQNECTLAYWHMPRFSSGHHGSFEQFDDFWEALYSAGVDIVLNGHDHNYERFAPQDPDGNVDPSYGIREFVVGTGGRNHTKGNEENRLGTSEVFDNSTFGVLELSLGAGEYGWSFIPVADAGEEPFTDQGKDQCHAAPPPSQATPQDTPLATPLAILPSPQANGEAMAFVLRDDFSSGGLSEWTQVTGLTVEPGPGAPQIVVRANANSEAAFGRRKLDGSFRELSFKVQFNIQSHGSDSFNLLKIRTVDDEAIVGVHVTGDGRLGYRNDVSGDAVHGNTPVSMNTWHTLEVRIVVNGSDGAISISLDGALISELIGSENFGSAPIGWIQLGENSPGATFEVLFANFEIGGLDQSPTGGPNDQTKQ